MDGMKEVHGGKRLQFRLAGRAIGHHRRAIWNEAKHYTWILAGLAAVLAFVGTRVDIDLLPRAIVVMIGCVAGAAIGCIAMRVVRREVEVLDAACRIYDRLGEAMGLEGGALAAPGKPNKGFGRLVAGVCGSRRAKMETWDWFQFSFIVAALVYFFGFIAVLVVAIVV